MEAKGNATAPALHRVRGNTEQDVLSMMKDEKVINFFLLITSCYPF